MTIASQLFAELDSVMDKCFGFTNDALPESFQSKNPTRSLKSIKNKTKKAELKKVDPRTKRNSPERLQTIALYATMAQKEEPIVWCENPDRQYRAMVAFATMLIETKVLDAEDFEEENA